MIIKETGKVISVKRVKQPGSMMSTYEFTMQSLVRKNLVFHYEKLKTEPYIMTCNSTLVKVEVGDCLRAGTEILEGVGHCPKCGNVVFAHTEEGKISYSCEDSFCKFNIPDDMKGHTITIKEAYELLSKGTTGFIEDFEGATGLYCGYLCLDETGNVKIERAHAL